MQLLEGKKISDKILISIGQKIRKNKLKPVLAVVLVGENKASKIYVRLKQKAAQRIGIGFKLLKFKKSEREEMVIQAIKRLNGNKKINGIIVQLPLPGKFNTQKIINALDPDKDVDGFNLKNVREFVRYEAEIWPVLPHAIIRLIKSSGKDTKNKKAMILANSVRFGNVMKVALQNKGMKADYVLAKKIKSNLKKLKSSDIIVSAVGQPGLIRNDMIKKGVIIIDGGITKKGKKVFGDADFELVKDKAGYLTPVPGGVGPVTIACLLENVYLAAKKQVLKK